jgi:hypothetical protein
MTELASKLRAEFHTGENYAAWLADDVVLSASTPLAATIEEIWNVTWSFGTGPRLDPIQSMQRLYAAGFKDASLLCVAYATMMSESGRYLKAWHANVVRNVDGTVKRIVRESDPGKEYMLVKSIDLGYCQFNVTFNPWIEIEISETVILPWVETLFEEHPEYANAWEACVIAWDFFTRRGWTPWYAHTNGSYKRGLPSASLAVARFLRMKHVGDRPDVKWLE